MPRRSGNSACAKSNCGYRVRASAKRPSDASNPFAGKPLAFSHATSRPLPQPISAVIPPVMKKRLTMSCRSVGGRLLVPILRKRRGILVVGGKRLPIHDFNPRSWKNRRPRAWRRGFRSGASGDFRALCGSSSLTLTLSKNASTAGRSFAIAPMALAKSSFITATLASTFARSIASASAFSSARPIKRRIRRAFEGPLVSLFLDREDVARALGAGEQILAVIGIEELAERLDAANHHQKVILVAKRKHRIDKVMPRALLAKLDFKRSAKKERRSEASCPRSSFELAIAIRVRDRLREQEIEACSRQSA